MGKFIFIASFSLVFIINDFAQEPIILYNRQNQTAKIKYEYVRSKKSYTEQSQKGGSVHQIEYPAVGQYTPTSYSNGHLGIAPDRGFSDYIYFESKGKIVPGKKYKLRLKIEFDESFNDMSFFQDNFGIALTSYIYPNRFPASWGLWEHTHETLGELHGGEVLTIEKEFRPLCASKYVVFGVFKSEEKDPLSCFFCYYPFTIHEFSIVESSDTNDTFLYLCDEFKEEVEGDFNKKLFNVYFESGSSKIAPTYIEMLDSLVNRLKSTEEIIALSAHTDISGNDNFNLAASRNEAVRNQLINLDINPERIKEYNFSDSNANNYILNTDRRVEITLLKGESHRRYYSDALIACDNQDYASAHKILNSDWIATVPPKMALSAYFDDWGVGDKAEILKTRLLSAIKSKFYRGRDLNYKLDSLNYEWLKGRSLRGHLALMRMPNSKHQVTYSTSELRDSLLIKEADLIHSKHGFPLSTEVGYSAGHILPKIILTSNNLHFLEKYLPVFKQACEKRQLQWIYYARLFDKISILKKGYQRYGTNMMWDANGNPVPEFPIENIELLDEYRRQVKLVPLSANHTSSLITSHENLNDELIVILNEVFIRDQHYRNKIDERFRNFKRMEASDSINQIAVKKILDEHGWLGPDIIGRRGNQTLFLVIQHADLNTQLQYLPMLKEAVAKGNANAVDLALLEDRVALRQGQKQVYGSQVVKNKGSGTYQVAPMLDPMNVNSRRKAIGLGSIESYLARWDIDWKTEIARLIRDDK